MQNFDLNERIITAAEFAASLGVTEDDVLRWMLAGRIPYVDGPEGEPRVRIREAHSVDGPLTTWVMAYPMSRDAEFQGEVSRRQCEFELEAMDWGEVDLEALTHALSTRLHAVAPSVCHVAVDGGTIWLRDARGRGAGIDVALAASFPESGSGADRVRSAAASALEKAQDEFAEVTTDPWPR